MVHYVFFNKKKCTGITLNPYCFSHMPTIYM